MINTDIFNELFTSPIRKLGANVELYKGSTLANSFYHYDKIKEITIDRVGEDSKFFGFGICQKATAKILDNNREIDITTDDSINIKLGSNEELLDNIYPKFYIEEVNRDENTNDISITAYDLLYDAANHTAAELQLEAPYTLADVAAACASLLGISFDAATAADSFSLSFDGGANIDGTETIRELLNDIAEATQTIYFINGFGYLVFKQLDRDGEAAYTIDKKQYITLKSKTNKTLAAIASVTELGDNVSASFDTPGETQYIRDNVFLELREDIGELIVEALDTIGDLSINQFECEWRGNFLLEIGDKINLITKDDATVTSYVLNDSITYNGGLKQKTEWNYAAADGTDTNSANLGETLKKTFAKVDKANKEIELIADETAALKLTAESISASVKKVDDDIADLSREVNAKMTEEEVNISIQKQLANGIDKVTTSTGFTFNEDGLHISKSNSEITTTITEDGMKVLKNSNEMLKADNSGVKAEDLHATTFLIIGDNSRLEDYDNNRTGCFWIGGVVNGL